MKYIRILAVVYLIIWAFVALAGCSRVQYVPVPSVRHDTAYINRVERDSVFRYDSIYVRDKGDTVYLEKYKYLFVDKLVHDTLYINQNDSVRVPYPVEKQLTRWEQFRLDVGGYAIVCVVIIILIVVGWLVYKLKK